MPSAGEYVRLAARHAALVRRVASAEDELLPWVVTGLFYAACALVHAVLRLDYEPRQFDSHVRRAALITAHRLLGPVAADYQALLKLSSAARYDGAPSPRDAARGEILPMFRRVRDAALADLHDHGVAVPPIELDELGPHPRA